MWVRSLGQEDSLEKEMATPSSILAWRIPWTEEPPGYCPQDHEESDTTKQLGRKAGAGFAPVCPLLRLGPARPEFPLGAPNPESEGEEVPATDCRLSFFLAPRHPPSGGKVPPSLQEGRPSCGFVIAGKALKGASKREPALREASAG